MNDRKVTVIGAGLAGCEAAYQLAERGVPVSLYEMKPGKRSPAHKSNDFCELVCSNSLRADGLLNGPGLLKEEMRLLHSLVMECADATRVPAGGALAVDRERFSAMVTERIRKHPNIDIVPSEASKLPEGYAVVATGPLTDGELLENIKSLFGEGLHFYDAAAPVVSAESLDMDKVFRASRYNEGSDYLNCPMNREEYFLFLRALQEAETVPLKEFETLKVFEGCMPVEAMAKRGDMTLAFGPLKPVGLRDERKNERPFAVVQLRQDNSEATLYNMVGFQTNLKFGEQRRVFGMIPGLEHAEFVRYGVMHRNTFLPSPGKLGWDYSCKAAPNLYFAGQITGVEGYIESAASGLAAGIELARKIQGREPLDFTNRTAMGALAHYISEYGGGDFQPMNINFGLLSPIANAPKGKKARYEALSMRALAIIREIIANRM